MAKHEHVLPEVLLRRVIEAASELARDLEAQRWQDEPQQEQYDIECGCRELLDYIRNYRTECEAREAAQVGDEYAEFRHQHHELV